MPDANTLIYLAKAGQLDLLKGEEILVAQEVHTEAVERGKNEGYTDAFLLDAFVEAHCRRGDRTPPDDLRREERFFGGVGEAGVFLLSNRTEDATIITSDQAAYAKLERRGCNPVRTDMLLYCKFKDGEISRYELFDHLMSLRQVGGTTDQRMAFLMTKTEETER